MDELKNRIQVGKVFFFAGAGVSFDSGLVDPKEVITGTCKRILPEFASTRTHNDKRTRLDEAKEILPEVFYSELLYCSGDERCLQMWRCLKKEEWVTPDYYPVPNINHLFLVLYSYKNHVPLFTVNFDPMFELAASLLRIDYTVLTHKDNPPLYFADRLYICKLHGDISENISSKTICTTIDTIATSNVKWLNFIEELLHSKAICFIGYSGRDVDYYPHFREMKPYQSFWMKASKETKLRAEAIGAIIYEKYPRDFFQLYFSKDFAYKLAFDKAKSSNTTGKNVFLEHISSSIPNISFNHEIFWIHLMCSTGRIDEAKKCLNVIDNTPTSLSKEEQLILLQAKATVCREQANFPQYRKNHRELIQLGGNRILSEFEIISSYQMTVPQEPRMPFWMFPLRRPFLLIYVMRKFALFLEQYINEYASHKEIIQEALIRNLSIYIGIAGSSFIPYQMKKCSFRYYLQHRVSITEVSDRTKKEDTGIDTYRNDLLTIKAEAERIGNISGINSCLKYLRRPVFSDIYDAPDCNVSRMVFKITEDPSAESNDIAHSGGSILEAVQKAIENDNVLNVCKFILEANRQKAPEWEKNIDIYFEYVKKIKPIILSKTYWLLGKYYFTH